MCQIHLTQKLKIWQWHRYGIECQEMLIPVYLYSSSRKRVIYHNWSATKQRPHPQSVE